MSDMMSTLREHAPSLAAAKEAGEAVRSHLPSVDVDAVREHLPSMDAARGKRSVVAAVIGAVALAAALVALLRRSGS